MADDEIPEFKEASEGIKNISDEYGRTFSRALSTTSIEVYDLISEGPIYGLVDGKYTYEVEPFAIGYKNVNFEPYPNPPGTTKNWLKSVFWNDVPVISADNKYNFQNIDLSIALGEENGNVLGTIIPKTTISRTIGERFRATQLDSAGNPILDGEHAKTYRILNPECKAIYVNIRVQNLQQSESKTSSNIVDSAVKYRVYFRPIYSVSVPDSEKFLFAKEITIEGKIQYGMIKSDRINFYSTSPNVSPRNLLGWEIKLVRITPDSLTTTVRNILVIDSITEVYEDYFSYPKSAIVKSRFNSEYFSQIPNRYFDAKLLKVKIPKGYDPIKKTYQDPWDGTFQEEKQWTDNPAWCFYDLITNKTYGLGNYIEEDLIDTISLYEISKYCDTMVPDGYGGWEPRFRSNLVINNREEAYKVINDFASIFRGLVYFGKGLIYTIQDSPKDNLITIFTNANVKEGNFNYSSSSRRVRHTVGVVRYNDENNQYKPSIEYVEDIDGIRKYGIREIEINALGCTSRGQAVRQGRWVLLSETLETETIAFTAGIEAVYLKPGDIFGVVDNNKKSSRFAGRTQYFNYNQIEEKTTVVLDSNPNLMEGVNYVFTLITPSYQLDPSFTQGLTSENINDIRKSFLQSGIFNVNENTVQTENGKTKLILAGKVFDDTNYSIYNNTVWSIHMNSGYTTYDQVDTFLYPYTDFYRVINIEEKENFEYNIVGLQYNPQKYLEIESGLNFERNSLSQNIPETPAFAYSETFTSSVENQQAQLAWVNSADFDSKNSHTAIFVSDKNDVEMLNQYNIPSKRKLHSLKTKKETSLNLEINNPGDYIYSIWGYNSSTNTFSPSGITGFFSIEKINPIQNIMISSLSLLTGDNPIYDGVQGVSRSFDRSYDPNPEFTWQVGSIGQSFPNNVFYRLSVRPPSESNIPNSLIYTEYTGLTVYSSNIRQTFSFEDNLSSSGGPHRNYDVVIEAMNLDGQTSAGNQLYVNGNHIENWTNTYGYDIIHVENERITGFYLSNPINTITGDYITSQFIDSALTINIKYTSGILPTDIAGGYLYFSTGLFSGQNITGNPLISSIYNIYTGSLSYDLPTQTFYCPLPNDNKWFSKSGYAAISIYDTFDQAIIENSDNLLRTGLYLSNIVPINYSGILNQLTVGGYVSFINHEDANNNWNMKTNIINGKRILGNYFGNNDEEGAIINSEI